VIEVFRAIYADPERNYTAYDMCEKLVDVEERFQLWRFRHMTTVKRIIGFAFFFGAAAGSATANTSVTVARTEPRATRASIRVPGVSIDASVTTCEPESVTIA